MFIKQLSMTLISCCLIACAGTSERDDTGTDQERTGRNDCISERSIRGYTVLDEQNLIVEASGRRQYHVVLRRRARGIRSSHGIEFDTTTSRVCAGFDGIRFHDGIGYHERMSDSFDVIRIASIRELTVEDEEHLLIQYGKKEPEIKQTPAPQEVPGAEVEELDEAASE